MAEVVRQVVEEVLGRRLRSVQQRPGGGSEPARPNYQRERARERMAQLAAAPGPAPSLEPPRPADAAKERLAVLSTQLRRTCLTQVCQPDPPPPPRPESAVARPAGDSSAVWRLDGDDGLWWFEGLQTAAVPDRLRAVLGEGPTVVVAIGRPALHHILQLAAALAALAGAGVRAVGGPGAGGLLVGVTHPDARGLRAWARQAGSRLERADLGRQQTVRVLDSPSSWVQAALDVPAAEALGSMARITELDAVVLVDRALRECDGFATSIAIRAGWLLVTGSGPGVRAMLDVLVRLRERLRIPLRGDR